MIFISLGPNLGAIATDCLVVAWRVGEGVLGKRSALVASIRASVLDKASAMQDGSPKGLVFDADSAQGVMGGWWVPRRSA